MSTKEQNPWALWVSSSPSKPKTGEAATEFFFFAFGIAVVLATFFV